MAVYTTFFVSFPGIHHIPVGQHGTSFIRDVEEITMAFLTLLVLERGISIFPSLYVIIFVLEEVDNDVFHTVKGLGVKKVDGTLGGGKVTIHAIRHKALGVVGMGRGLPGVVSELDLMADGAKLRGGRADHGVVGDAEKWESYEETTNDQQERFEHLFSGESIKKPCRGIHRASRRC